MVSLAQDAALDGLDPRQPKLLLSRMMQTAASGQYIKLTSIERAVARHVCCCLHNVRLANVTGVTARKMVNKRACQASQCYCCCCHAAYRYDSTEIGGLGCIV